MSGVKEGVRPIRRGKVWLVGAGPGDPGLLTMRAHALVIKAEVVAYDELVSRGVLALVPEKAELIRVGRRANGCKHHDARIHPLVVARALEGRDVIRLKGGDPFVFGRGGEEAEELAAARIPFEVVPGISAAFGAAASARIPLTHRDCASSLTLGTAHSSGDAADHCAGLPREGTLVLYMALGRLESTCARLVADGRARTTPAAVVSRATLADERVLIGTLADIALRVREARVEAPALLIVGEVVARRVESARVWVASASAATG